MNEALQLVSSGCVPRKCGVQVGLIDLLCQYGADANYAMAAALPHGEFQAMEALLQNGARIDLFVSAGLGRTEEFRRLLPTANSEERHRALAVASQFGHTEIVQLLLDAGEDPNRYNPIGTHSHSTPLHQAAIGGHLEVVRLLVEHGARTDTKDTAWQSTPSGWAKHGGKIEVLNYLRSKEVLARNKYE
jgi:ankyrin repeat protein